MHLPANVWPNTHHQSTTPNKPWGLATSTVPASIVVSAGSTIVYGMHVNGFNILNAASTSSSSSGTTTALTTPVSTLITTLVTTPLPSTPTVIQPNSSASMSSISVSSSFSKGTVAGIAIGIVLVVILIATVGWFLFTRSGKESKGGNSTSRDFTNFATKPPGLQGLHGVDGRSRAKVSELGT